MVTLIDSPGIMLQRQESGTSAQIIRSAVQVDDLIDPVAYMAELVEKIEKTEILRHYRIANYTNVTQMLEFIALKKGL